MVHLSQEVDNLLVRKHLLLQLFECLGNLEVIHVETLVLLEVFLLQFKFIHEDSLLAEEHLLSCTVNHLREDLLGKHQDVVEGSSRQLYHLESELIDRTFKLLVLLANHFEIITAQLFDHTLTTEAQANLAGELLVQEDALVVDHTATEESL